MSYQEKKTITSLVSGLVLMVAYAVNAWLRYRAGTAPAADLTLWAGLMLRYIGLGIIVTILVQILFHILLSVGVAVKAKIRDADCDDKGIERSIKQEMVEDERDKLIQLKSLRSGFIMAGMGFFFALISLLLGHPPVVMLNIMFFSFYAGSLLEGLAQLYYYRKGL
ncbi:MAG: hypothetical protein KKI09_15825 [Spirochaetes bacterium]|nr:hypothetical protein [Spirochaetota bacterium]MBU0956891.1 hypothetical protein [Spirochaetota bacterium]